jgi:hypothetical protein
MVMCILSFFVYLIETSRIEQRNKPLFKFILEVSHVGKPQTSQITIYSKNIDPCRISINYTQGASQALLKCNDVTVATNVEYFSIISKTTSTQQ